LPRPKINTSNPLRACKNKHVANEYLRYTIKKMGDAIAVKIKAVRLRSIICPKAKTKVFINIILP